jgi:glycosyltransferase involved in cell wall biosynthesis
LLSGSQSRDRINFVGSINDKEYLNFLKHAFCLATASKAEGFGLPIVEAMQAGCPVVCSDIEIFREIASDAALFFNNDNPEDFAEKIIYLQSEKIRQKITKAGIDAARKFSWRKSAYKLKSILSDVD